MDTLLFLLMFAGAWLVLGWYVHNEARGAGGSAGLLAIRNEARPGRDGATYRMRARRVRSSLQNLPDTDGSPRYRPAPDGASYRAVDRAAFVDRGASYREKARAKDSA
jgi:hypothetical protein